MFRGPKRLVAGGAVAALALWLAGCGEGKVAEPKVANPENQKQLPVQTPPPLGGAPAQKGAPAPGVQ